jgi:hypothetical protein
MCLSGLRPKVIFILSVFVFLSLPQFIRCQDLEPRACTNIPVGINFAPAGYAYTAGGVLFDPAVPLENANIKIHAIVCQYRWGKSIPRIKK